MGGLWGGRGGGGGAKAMLAPLSNYWGGGLVASPLSTPMQINAVVRLNCIQLSSVGSDR